MSFFNLYWFCNVLRLFFQSVFGKFSYRAIDIAQEILGLQKGIFLITQIAYLIIAN